jgi:hypothetical protein
MLITKKNCLKWKVIFFDYYIIVTKYLPILVITKFGWKICGIWLLSPTELDLHQIPISCRQNLF